MSEPTCPDSGLPCIHVDDADYVDTTECRHPDMVRLSREDLSLVINAVEFAAANMKNGGQRDFGLYAVDTMSMERLGHRLVAEADRRVDRQMAQRGPR